MSMATILRVAKTELRTLFFSPIAWFLLIIFLVQCSISYTNILEILAREKDAGSLIRSSMTEHIFLGRKGLFGSVLQSIYLYMPLLTMGLISRETASGTIKLLHSSPVKIREIVLGKFLSMMIYSLLLVAIIGCFVIAAQFHIVSPDNGKLLSALLGCFLLLCAYSAIGLFMSSLTSYQIVAAISTFVMFGILSYIGNLWQGVAFVRNLTYFLSISGRAGQLLNGLITTKDIIYFLVIVYMFLGFSIYKMRADIESRPRMVRWGRYASILVIALTIGYISSIPSLVGYYDASAHKANTLTPNAQRIIKELGDTPLEVTAYNNLLDRFYDYGSPESYNTNLARWEPFLRFKHNIKLNTVQYYDTTFENPNFERFYGNKPIEEIGKRVAESRDLPLSFFKSPAEIRKIINLKPELNRYVMQLKYGNKTTFLRIFNDMHVWPSETEISAAFKRLLQAKMPKIVFLTGNLERDINKVGDREYKVLTNLKTYRQSFINQGFDVDTLSLATQEIPEGISALVLADPKVALTETEMNKLKKFIDDGGNMLIAGEPGKQSILNPLLAYLNVQLLDGILVQPSREMQPELLTPLLTETVAGFFPPLAHSHHDSARATMPGATALSYSDSGSFTIKPLLVSDAKRSWLKKEKLVSDSAEVIFAPEKGDIKQAFPTALGLTRDINGKQQRIIVTGDADFMSNAELQRFNLRAANFVFNTGLFSWLSYNEFPIDSSRPPAEDISIIPTKSKAKFIKLIFVWVVPAILLAFGALLLIRRKRK
ncbi:ABC-2 type transport system permease protein [Pseudobacter ginsenosidimutans]|uniref:ABC-2 type transport system permease protein n=2 Tax=Pseudobacter ginsenosidimutans TaxID=661488 RepID=A0A4Q7MZA2_9BACT|nr:ABC-2 type transport system permease protein [Pseudobacter ginsenosidimutans]